MGFCCAFFFLQSSTSAYSTGEGAVPAGSRQGPGAGLAGVTPPSRSWGCHRATRHGSCCHLQRSQAATQSRERVRPTSRHFILTLHLFLQWKSRCPGHEDITHRVRLHLKGRTGDVANCLGCCAGTSLHHLTQGKDSPLRGFRHGCHGRVSCLSEKEAGPPVAGVGLGQTWGKVWVSAAPTAPQFHPTGEDGASPVRFAVEGLRAESSHCPRIGGTYLGDGG